MEITCPGCDGRLVEADRLTFKCESCGGLIGYGLTLAESFRYVKPQFSKEDVPPTQTRYYDMTGTDGASGNRYRRHGWYDPRTRLITQVG
jgi:hypothetical protein